MCGNEVRLVSDKQSKQSYNDDTGRHLSITTTKSMLHALSRFRNFKKKLLEEDLLMSLPSWTERTIVSERI